MQELVVRLKELALDQGPDILIAVAILIVGWVVALLGGLLVRKAFKRTEIDNKIATWIVGEERAKSIEIERWIGRCVFFLIMLFVLVAFFETLGLAVITVPLSRFLIQIFDYAPRLIAPAVLLLLAWVAATGLRFLVRKLLSATSLDQKLGSEVGLEEGESIPLSRTLGDAVYWLIFLLFLPAVLGALNLSGLLQPVQGMLDKILGFLPNLFAAGLILGVGWLLARIVQRIAGNLLAAVGADRLSEHVGLSKALGDQKLSGLAGLVLYVLILVPVLVASLNALALDAITRPASEMLSTFLAALPLVFAGHVLLGLVIFAVGLFLASLADRTVNATAASQAPVLAVAARVSILILAGAMALRQMGLANEIITLAFGLLLGAIAVAVAIAFGIGGRDLAAETLGSWRKRMEKK